MINKQNLLGALVALFLLFAVAYITAHLLVWVMR